MTFGVAYSSDMSRELTVERDENAWSESMPPPTGLTRDQRRELREAQELLRRQGEALASGRKAKRPRPFTYTWSDLEAAFGRSKRQLQRWAARGDFDPADFASVAKLLREREASKQERKE
jgi:hypothetical protein